MTLGQFAASRCSMPEGRHTLRTARAGDLWYFPAGLPHSLQGPLVPRLEFLVICFDDGRANEVQYPSAVDWFASYPARRFLAQDVRRFPAQDFSKIPLARNLRDFSGHAFSW